MASRFLLSGLLGAAAVGLGAFGAHGLKERLAALPPASGWWETATFYLLVHAVAIGAVGSPSAWPARLWSSGALIFSGTLYVMALGGPRWLGAVTPVGGTMLIAGWIMLAFAARKSSPTS
jgi:uncharacterized membrane protein YgdD (TMEM256/DUF423 family)